MRIGRLARMGKKVIDGRGGKDGLKRDAQQLKGIAQGQGSAKEKARKAADALKQPTAPEHGGDEPHTTQG